MKTLRNHWLSGAAGCVLALALAPIATADDGEAFVGVPVAATPELIVRDDLGPDFGSSLDAAFDADDQWSSIVQLFRLNNTSGVISFNCTGTLINPRTVLTAAHCVNGVSSEAYGQALGAQPFSMLVGFGPDTFDGLITFAGTGATYSEGGVAWSTDVVIHPFGNLDNAALPFPWADVAMIALNEPITDVPSMGMLLSPLQELTHVIQAGYGGFGTGVTGNVGIDFRRLVGENELGMIGSVANFLDGVFPGIAPSSQTIFAESQVMYWTDFDRPNREADEDLCTFTAVNISCPTLAAVQSIDWFTGDALPNEAGTAGGDSGSPLIADQIADMPLIIGVLSGGFDFFGIGNTYGDVSFYNPLFPFFEFISANTPYKYVSAVGGDGDWFDPEHWTQDLDPNFFIIDDTGAIVNGVPEGPEDGVYASGPKIGDVLGDDVSDGDSQPTPTLPPRTAGAEAAGAEALTGAPGSPDSQPADVIAAQVDLDAVSDMGQGVAGKVAHSVAQSTGGDMTTQDAPNFGDNLPQSSNLQGPGSTGFVPDNTDGVVGTAFENPAQYFDVSLLRAGTTTLASDGSFLPVEIDQLTLMNTGAVLSIENGAELTSLIGVNVLLGTLDVRADAAVITPLLINDLGVVTGSGVFVTDIFLNRGGMVDPYSDPAAFGGSNTIAPGGDIFIVGNYIQQAQGVTKLDVLAPSGEPFAMDSLTITGGALLDGTILVTADPTIAVRGSTYTGITTGAGVVGTFANEMTQYSATLSFDVVYGPNSVSFEAVAADFADTIPGSDPNALALANALDGATSPDSLPSGEFGTVIASLDTIGGASALEAALSSMTPRQTFVLDQLGVNASRSFTSTLFDRGRLARREMGGATGGLTLRRDDAPIQLASAGSTAGLLQPAERVLPDNMSAWVAGDVAFAGDIDPAVTGDVRNAQVSAGLEARLGEALVGGVAVSGGWIEGGDGDHEFDGDTYGLAGYLGFAARNFYAGAHAGYLEHAFEIERPVFTGAGLGSASGGADGSQVFAGVEAGLNLPLGEVGLIGPVARLRYADLEIDGYTEAGAGGFGSVIDDRSQEQTVASLGVTMLINANEKLFFTGEVLREELIEGDAAPTVSAALVSQPGASYTLTGVAPAEEWVSVSLGAGYEITPNVLLRGRYGFDGGAPEYDFEHVNVSLSFRF
ncbi:MAG: autotransporter domain-containing protein [Oceanicaulis sp.]